MFELEKVKENFHSWQNAELGTQNNETSDKCPTVWMQLGGSHI